MKKLLFFAYCLIGFTINAQQTEYVDFKRVESVIFYNQIVVDSTVYNSYDVTFDVLKKTDSIYLDAIDMRFKGVALNGKAAKYRNDGKKLIIYDDFEASKDNKLHFVFFTSPKKAMYFVGWENAARNQIWTQGQGKYTSHWLPSINDMNEKIEFDLSYAAPKKYEVISNGKMVLKINNAAYDLWEFDMKKPMSSYLLASVLGKYDKKVEVSKSGIPLVMYYYPGEESRVEPTYRYTKLMFDYLENEIGVPYPWQNYKQIPVHDFLYAGMENTGTTIFSDDFLIDETAFVDRNYVNVNAHELAHQWFGNLVTAKSGTHHWLQEGFATYYALLVEQKVFGDNYFYWKLYESAQQLAQQDKAGNGTSLLNPKSSSLTFYQKGAWAIYMLRELIGDVAFKNTIKRYLNTYEFRNANTEDFFKIAQEESEQDLSEFYKVWFEDKEFPVIRVMDALKHNSIFINEYVMVDCDVANSKCIEYLVSTLSDEAKIKIIQQNPKLVSAEVFKNSLKVRQAIAQYVSEIPKGLKREFETLLKDKSYVTVESALYNLWINFPGDRAKYLHETRDIIGFNDYNVRMLWLALHLNTPDYQTSAKEAVLEELTNYTSEAYNAQIRIAAFSYLNMMKACKEECVKNLEDAKTHHNWRLTKFAKNMLAKQ